MSDSPSLARFSAECEHVLSAHFEVEPRATGRFEWGVGSDQVGVYDEPDPAEEQDAVARTRAWRRLLWDNGFGWITGPREYGGRALPERYQRAFDDVARGYRVPGNAKVLVSLGMIAPTILAHGSARARERYLAAMHAGDVIACQLFSEPAAGSDLASITTRATRHGDGWRISGQKVWTSGAHYSDIGEVLCKTSAGPRHHNLTVFVIDMRAPGVEVRPLRQMTGGSAFNEVFLSDVWVPDEDRLGAVDEGWAVALTTLSHERTSLGDAGFGGLGLFSAERYRQMVRAFGLADDPVVRQSFAELVIHLRAAKYHRMRLASEARAGRKTGSEGAVAKLQLADNYRRISDFASEILGARLAADSGEWGTFAWSEFVLGVPGMAIAGGTDEIIKTLLAERVLGLPKS